MELCDGDLAGLLEDCPPGTENGITTADVWHIMVQIANGLVHVHGLGEVHRDLKPHNSMPILLK
jgi:serine/threonine protein kinase